jgi:hypothetical protein
LVNPRLLQINPNITQHNQGALKMQKDKSWYELKHFFKNIYYIEDIRSDIVKESFSSYAEAQEFIAIFEKRNKLTIKDSTGLSYFARWADTDEHRQKFLSRLMGGHLNQYFSHLKPTERMDLRERLKNILSVPEVDPAEALFQKTRHIKGT